MSNKVLAYNAYLQIFALFETRQEALVMQDEMRKCGHMLAIVEVEQFHDGVVAFKKCEPKPIVIRDSNPKPSAPKRDSRYENRNQSSRSYGPSNVSDSGYRSSDDMFRATIDSFGSGSSCDSGYSDSGSSSGCSD